MEFLTASSMFASQVVNLAWDASKGAAGYMIYTSADGVHFNAPIDVGSKTNLAVSGLAPGATNFFYVTSYDASHHQSSPSKTVAYIVPGGLSMAKKTSVRAPSQLNFSVAAGHSYRVQASVDLVTWVTVWQTNATANQVLSYSDPLGANLRMRFYRTVQD